VPRFWTTWIKEELVEFMISLYQIKNQKMMSNGFKNFESPLTSQNKLRDLAIDPEEFSSILRLIFNRFDDTHTID